jgi:hypothetical protein
VRTGWATRHPQACRGCGLGAPVANTAKGVNAGRALPQPIASKPWNWDSILAVPIVTEHPELRPFRPFLAEQLGLALTSGLRAILASALQAELPLARSAVAPSRTRSGIHE